MGQLGNGVYTSGNKGSNFDFELKTLRALEQIAVLIEAGGGGGGQNLQQVCTLGNTTNTDVIISDGALTVGSPIYSAITLYNRDNIKTGDGGAFSTTLNYPLTPIGGVITTLPISVNGNTADAYGEITLPGQLADANSYPVIFQAVTGSWTLIDSKALAHYYKFGSFVQVYATIPIQLADLTDVSTIRFTLPFTPLTADVIGSVTVCLVRIPESVFIGANNVRISGNFCVFDVLPYTAGAIFSINDPTITAIISYTTTP